MEKMRILAIDDNTINLATIEQELKDKYEVIPMISGRRAVKFLYREKVDLILLDVQMPIMDGIETLKEIRKQKNGITVPVIFLTARKDTTTVIEGSKLGIMDYIVKPFDSEYLHERIERVFKRLGVLPIEPEELHARLCDIRDDIEQSKKKTAIIKTDEVLGYQIDEAISGRMQNVKTRMEDNNMDAALSMVRRVIKLVETTMLSSAATLPPISISELNSRLLHILSDLESFRTADADLKVQELLRFDLPVVIHDSCFRAMEKIEEYDDDEAENYIRKALQDIKTPENLIMSDGERMGAKSSAQGGYYSSLLKGF